MATEEETKDKESFHYRVELPADLAEELKRLENQGGEDSRPPSSPPQITEVEELKKRIEELELLNAELTEERDQWKEKYLRALADLENSRKRFQRDSLELRRYGHEVAIREILPILDNLERAVETGKTIKQGEHLISGLEMIIRHFYQILEKLGVTPVPSLGEPFNPEIHEAFQEEEREDLPPNTVVAEVQKGFRLHERLLRPAKVIVSRPPAVKERELTGIETGFKDLFSSQDTEGGSPLPPAQEGSNS